MSGCIRVSRTGVRNDNNVQTHQQQYAQIIKVYTDWANHYLDKAKSKRNIKDLQSDLADGVLLSDLVETICNHRLLDVNRKPRTHLQMLGNIKSCLDLLETLGVALDGITAHDVKEGNLKAILGLFFALSKYKQKQKQQQKNESPKSKIPTDMKQSRLPGPTLHSGSITNIPTPFAQRFHQLQNTPAANSPYTGLKCTSNSSSRSTSPHTFIPSPKTIIRTPVASTKNTNQKNGVPVKTNIASPYSSATKNSALLEKLKASNQKEKCNKQVISSTKRTSSSSGFSSARSERSDSSNSLSNEPKPVPSLEKKENHVEVTKPVLRKKIARPPVPSESRLSKISLKSTTPPKCENPQRKSAEILNSDKEDLSNSSTMDLSQSQSVRLSGTGIPKPVATVKGMAKPTHTVAPMLQINSESRKIDDTLEKNIVKPLDSCSEPTKSENTSNLILNEIRHDKQRSFTEEDDPALNVKPMEPLLRGYKRSIIVPQHRTIPSDLGAAQNNCINGNFQEKRISADSDYGQQSSGYVSDGDVLQYDIQSRPILATDPGYMSEGPVYNDSKSGRYQNSIINKQNAPVNNQIHLKHRVVSIDRLDAKINEPNLLQTGNKTQVKLNRFNVGPDGGSSSLGPDVSPPTSPPEPTPVAPVYKVVTRSHVKKSDSGQQTELNNSSLRQSSQWKKYIEAGKNAEQIRVNDFERVRDKQSPRRTDKKRSTDGSREDIHNLDYMERKSRSDRSDKTKARGGVPQSFGYVKRSTSSSNGKGDPRTAQVSAVPRTKVKVSGGTQTDMKTYSVSGPSATQLSQSVRERLMANQSEQEAKIGSPYGTWMRHSPVPPHYTASLPSRTGAIGGMIEADSIESLPAQLHHRASLTHSRLMSSASPNTSPSPSQSNRISRSNSISYLRDRTFPRSTKSEKLYPSMLQRSDEPDSYYSIPYASTNRSDHRTYPHASQPTSPTPASRYNFQSPQPNHRSVISSPYAASIMSKINSKDDDAHGSALSLISTGSSSLYSGMGADEKQAQEVRRLRRDLSDAQDKVHTLTSQLSTNAHVVSAFEQSLSNMTQRLQQLTATAEKKDHELHELRQTVEMLRKQSADPGNHPNGNHQRRHTINSVADSTTGNNISRQLSTDSVSSLNSLSSACSASSSAQQSEADKKKKRGWLRSSFSKAFSRSKKNRSNSLSDAEEAHIARNHQNAFLSDLSAPSSPMLNTPHMNGLGLKNSHSSTTSLYDCDRAEHDSSPEMVEQLRKQLREKDLVLTDIRLEALSSAHQLESLKDTVIKMRDEMLNLKQDNERLQKIVTNQSLQSSCSSLQSPPISNHTQSDELAEALLPSLDSDSMLVQVNVFLGSHGGYNKYKENKTKMCIISALPVSPKSKWDMVDHLVVKGFKDYVERIDPTTKLGLCADSIWSYHVDDITRYISNTKDYKPPEKSPYECMTNGSNISICLKGAMHSGCLDALAFDTLIPKSILQRYVSLLSEHHRIILCGPSGTGKSYLSNKLAEFLVMKMGKECNASTIVTFSVDDNNNKDLQHYLSEISDQADCDASQIPCVVILDNLHKALSLPDVFNGFQSPKCPYIIGTINQSTCSTTSLQLHHNFRWVLCANHMEPMKGFLGRHLRRKLVEHECRLGQRNAQLKRIVEWIPEVRNHLNQLLETHSSSEVTLGPVLFISCPMDLETSQIWFSDLWNYSLVPYIMDMIREGIRLYGKRAAWKDPTLFLIQSYPWSNAVHKTLESFIRIRPEDVGYDLEHNHDPLLNMLMTLQEAANYSSPQNDTDISLPNSNGTLATL